LSQPRKSVLPTTPALWKKTDSAPTRFMYFQIKILSLHIDLGSKMPALSVPFLPRYNKYKNAKALCTTGSLINFRLGYFFK
jgi:hypothetical protein